LNGDKMNLTIIRNPSPPKSDYEPLLLEKIIREKEKENSPYNTVDDFDLDSAIANGFHIITVAFVALTHFSTICEFKFGINQESQYQLVTPIIEKKETGTLYPLHKLTILPYPYLTTRFGVGGHDYTNGKGFTIEEIEGHIKDAFKAEIDYVKSGKLFFEFRDLGKDMLRYRNRTYRYLMEDYKDYDWDCYMYSFDNYEFE